MCIISFNVGCFLYRQELEMKKCTVYEQVNDLPALPKSEEDLTTQDLVFQNNDYETIPGSLSEPSDDLQSHTEMND